MPICAFIVGLPPRVTPHWLLAFRTAWSLSMIASIVTGVSSTVAAANSCFGSMRWPPALENCVASIHYSVDSDCGFLTWSKISLQLALNVSIPLRQHTVCIPMSRLIWQCFTNNECCENLACVCSTVKWQCLGPPKFFVIQVTLI